MSEISFVLFKQCFSQIVIIFCIQLVLHRIGYQLLGYKLPNKNMLLSVIIAASITAVLLMLDYQTNSLQHLIELIRQSVQGLENGEGGNENVTADTGVFVLFYLFTPLAFSIALISFGLNDLAMGVFIIAKGIFYICLALISTVEYMYVENADLGKLALGFTLSLAIFEAVTAVCDGISRIKKRTINEEKTHPVAEKGPTEKQTNATKLDEAKSSKELEEPIEVHLSDRTNVKADIQVPNAAQAVVPTTMVQLALANNPAQIIMENVTIDAYYEKELIYFKVDDYFETIKTQNEESLFIFEAGKKLKREDLPKKLQEIVADFIMKAGKVH